LDILILDESTNALDDENEDKVLVPSLIELESEKEKKFAISDGATESIFSREWSGLLVSCFKDKPFDMVNLPSTINAISKTWYSNISSIDLPWYAQEKLEIGAFATFLGLKLDLKDQVFEAVSIGDCTLFQIRNNEFLKSFPIEKYEEFGNTPALFSTNPKYQTNFEDTVKYLKVNVESGDLLILGWGGTYGALKTATNILIEEGYKVSHAHVRYLNPFPKNLGELMGKFKTVVIPELNNGQLSKIIRDKYFVDAIPYNKIQGQPFMASEVVNKIKEILS
jgi:hypothetical protein